MKTETKLDELKEGFLKIHDYSDSYEIWKFFETAIKELLSEKEKEILNEVDYFAQRNIECSIYENEVYPLIEDMKKAVEIKYNNLSK